MKKKWRYPEEAARKIIVGEVTLRFKLSKDGNLLAVYIIKTSGEEILDSAAIKAIKKAAPFSCLSE